MSSLSSLLVAIVLVLLLAPIQATTKPAGCACAPTSRRGGTCYRFTNAPKDLYWLPKTYSGVCRSSICQPKYVCKSGSRTWCTVKVLTRLVEPLKQKPSHCRIRLLKQKVLVPYAPTKPVRDPRYRKPASFHLYFAGDSNCWIFYRGKHIADCQNYRKLTIVRNIPITGNCDPIHVQLLDRNGSGRGFIAGIDASGHMIGSGGTHVRFSLKVVNGWTSTRFDPAKWTRGIAGKEMSEMHKDLKTMMGASAVTWKPHRKNQRVYIIISLKKFCQAPYWS